MRLSVQNFADRFGAEGEYTRVILIKGALIQHRRSNLCIIFAAFQYYAVLKRVQLNPTLTDKRIDFVPTRAVWRSPCR
ncbi:hypothetical protein D3C73_828960 [compost metagenome]